MEKALTAHIDSPKKPNRITQVPKAWQDRRAEEIINNY